MSRDIFIIQTHSQKSILSRQISILRHSNLSCGGGPQTNIKIDLHPLKIPYMKSCKFLRICIKAYSISRLENCTIQKYVKI